MYLSVMVVLNSVCVEWVLSGCWVGVGCVDAMDVWMLCVVLVLFPFFFFV